jgi:CMP/dCMP kinase
MPSTRAKPRTGFVVTIDGPAGVGKSTVAKLLAQRLRVMYLDTGATYRSVAFHALEAGLNTATDRRRILGLARRLPLKLSPRPDGGLQVILKGIDVTTRIRTEEVSEAAAQVSQYPEIRSAMVSLQRRLARRPWTDPHNGAPRQGVVVEGRDTGSVVFPAASFKFFLDADPAVRARRRQEELKRLYGSRPPLAQVREQIHFRDGLDKHRKVGPLVKPAGAVPIDTTHRTAQQVVRLMLVHIERTGGAAHRRRR